MFSLQLFSPSPPLDTLQIPQKKCTGVVRAMLPVVLPCNVNLLSITTNSAGALLFPCMFRPAQQYWHFPPYISGYPSKPTQPQLLVVPKEDPLFSHCYHSQVLDVVSYMVLNSTNKTNRPRTFLLRCHTLLSTGCALRTKEKRNITSSWWRRRRYASRGGRRSDGRAWTGRLP